MDDVEASIVAAWESYCHDHGAKPGELKELYEEFRRRALAVLFCDLPGQVETSLAVDLGRLQRIVTKNGLCRFDSVKTPYGSPPSVS